MSIPICNMLRSDKTSSGRTTFRDCCSKADGTQPRPSRIPSAFQFQLLSLPLREIPLSDVSSVE
jgi:hypothetical protein